MRGVYERNPQMGDPASLEPQITQTSQNVGRLRGQLTKYESWLAEAFRGEDSTNTAVNNNQHCSMSTDPSQNIYSEFDEDFDEDVETPIGKATALYTFQGSSQGTVSITSVSPGPSQGTVSITSVSVSRFQSGDSVYN
eukprot:XP_014044989.1 PREDICTED: cdc42-interacting protein 4 homolog [Salmo salar]